MTRLAGPLLERCNQIVDSREDVLRPYEPSEPIAIERRTDRSVNVTQHQHDARLAQLLIERAEYGDLHL